MDAFNPIFDMRVVHHVATQKHLSKEGDCLGALGVTWCVHMGFGVFHPLPYKGTPVARPQRVAPLHSVHFYLSATHLMSSMQLGWLCIMVNSAAMTGRICFLHISDVAIHLQC